MPIKQLAVLPSNEAAVEAINLKLGTDFTAADYTRWERGDRSRRSMEFDAAIKQYVGAPAFNAVGSLAKLWALVRYLVTGD